MFLSFVFALSGCISHPVYVREKILVPKEFVSLVNQPQPPQGGWTTNHKQGRDLAPYILKLIEALNEANRKISATGTLIEEFNKGNKK